ncbi:MAG: cysteine desulfurase NifS [Anaerolineae bacterium]|nr:cysteine desulfurase NifS [Anaerolineae bacterium]
MEKPECSIYMDHASTTAVDPRVVDAMLPYFTRKYGNSSSIHSVGREAAGGLEEARRTVADILGAEPEEIVFTGCGSESDNLAIRGVAFASRGSGNHIITSPIEHHAVGHTCVQLEKEFGFEVTYLPVDRYGVVDPEDVARTITDRTVLISIMYANNEVGTIEPVAEIARIARSRGIPFHTDAVQAGGALDLDVRRLGVDLLSLSAHKFYGPKGVGVLYVRQGTSLMPVQTGGGHERNRRAGTENVPYAVGLATALRLAQKHRTEKNQRLAALRDRLVEGVLSTIPDTELTGHPTERLPNNASFVFEGVEGESIVLGLDLAGVAASSGSACTTGEERASQVLTSMGIPPEIAHGSLRLTLGSENSEEDVDYVLSVLPGIIERLRRMSPLYQVA